MDGSKLSQDVVADCCATSVEPMPMGIDDVEQSFGHMELNDNLEYDRYLKTKARSQARGKLEIDPALCARKSASTRSSITSSIDSGCGDSISSTGSLSSFRSSCTDSSYTKQTPHLQSVPEKCTRESDDPDEGIEEDVVQVAECRFEEAVPFAAGLEQNQDGDTALHLNIIYMLIQNIFDIIANVPNRECLNIENLMLQCPLILAALTRQSKVVRRLMVGGADIEKTDRHGDTALHVACRNGDLQMVKALTTPISATEVRMYPCKYSAIVQRIPQDLNSRNYEGLTPFHLATIGNHHDVMSELAELGADVDAQEGRNGKRAIHMAVERNQEHTIKHLVEECAVDIDATTFYNLSPVILASDKRYHRIIEYLVQCGADHSDLDCSEVEDDSDSSEDVEMFDDFMINGEPVQS